MTNAELINLALETEDTSIRQQALSEHNQRVSNSSQNIIVAAGATELERKAAIEAQLQS